MFIDPSDFPNFTTDKSFAFGELRLVATTMKTYSGGTEKVVALVLPSREIIAVIKSSDDGRFTVEVAGHDASEYVRDPVIHQLVRKIGGSIALRDRELHALHTASEAVKSHANAIIELLENYCGAKK